MKKIIFIIFISLGISFSSKGQETDTFTLIVNIAGLKSNKGAVLLGLYNTKEAFLKKRFQSAVVKINNNKAAYVFEDLPKGTYAISFVHDENDNKKMDSNFFGIPKEAYGCSNNAKGFMGPPGFEDAKFYLEENKTIKIAI
jgi:uncharacterized protein (DUF2141 family)